MDPKPPASPSWLPRLFSRHPPADSRQVDPENHEVRSRVFGVRDEGLLSSSCSSSCDGECSEGSATISVSRDVTVGYADIVQK
jgi:hypothetical protein